MPGKEITIRVVLDDRDVDTPRVRKARGDLDDFARQAKSVGLALTAGITVPLGFIAREVLRVGTEYEKAMNLFQAATKASASEMQAAAAEAKRLGADMSLPATSAGDAARAMTELAKSGLTARQSMDAARGVLLLAAAAGIEEARAAEIAANALNAFHLEAKESARVADLLAAAANASSAEITDIALAMSQSSASAAALKIPIEDLVTSIGLMANAGIKGSDAGTSLKTMMAALTPQTDKAAAAMKQLGIDAFDANGKFVGFEEIIRQAAPALARMTDEQRAFAIETAFGSDAMRAANIILGQGVEKFQQMELAVGRSGAAAELAGARTKGLAGAWEGLKSQLETGALVIFERMSPALEKIVRGLAEIASNVIASATAFAKANPGLTEFGLKVGVVLAVAGPLLVAVGGLVAGIGLISTPVLAAVGAFAALGVGIAAMTTLIGNLGNAYTELSGATAKQVVEARTLTAQRKAEVDELERIVRSGSASQETYAAIIDEYRKLNPLTKARADLLVAESKETSEAKKVAEALLKVKRELYEQDKLAARIEFGKLARDFFDATQNLSNAQKVVERLGKDFEFYTKQVSEYQKFVAAGNTVTELQVELFEHAQSRLKSLSGEYNGARENVNKYQGELSGVARELNTLGEVYGFSKQDIIDHAKAIGANTGTTVEAIHALSRAGVAGAAEARKFSAAWVEAQDEVKRSGKTLANDLVSGFVQGIQSSQGKSITAVTNWMKAANQAAHDAVESKSPSKVFQRLGIDIGDGLVIGILAKASDVAKASRELARAAIDDARKAAAEAIALANASLATLQFKKQAVDAREFSDALEDVLKLRRELGQDETAALPRTRELAKALRDMLKEQAEGLKESKKRADELNQSLLQLAENNGDLLNAEAALNRDRQNWAAQQSQRWLESQRQQEQTIVGVSREQQVRSQAMQQAVLDARALRDEITRTQVEIETVSIGRIERVKLAELNARLEILQADERAKESIVASRVYIADQTVFHSDRATAAVLGHLAKQKGVTETVADAFISLYDGVFNKLDSLIDRWTSKLGIFGDFVGTLLKGIVNNLANQILGGLLGEGGILSRALNGIGGWLSRLLGGSGGSGIGGVLGNIFGGGALGATTPGFNPAAGGILGLLGGLFGGGGATTTASTALAGLSGFGSVAAGTSGAIGTVSAGSGLSGLLGGLGSFATSGLGIATFGIGTVAALVGTWLARRARQRRSDEEASGEALQAMVDLIKTTATDIDNNKLVFAEGQSQAFLNDSILQPFKDFINTLKTDSVRDSRLTNQVRDLENLYNSLVGDAVRRQQERIAAAASTTTTTATSTTGNGTDPLAGFTPQPTKINLELSLQVVQGTDTATKVVVLGVKTKEGSDAVVETVKIAEQNGEL